MRDEDHGHDLLLGDVVQIALVREVQDTVRVRDHAFPLFLRELEELHPPRVQGVPFCDPLRQDVHARRHLVIVGFGSEDGGVVAYEVIEVLLQFSVEIVACCPGMFVTPMSDPR